MKRWIILLLMLGGVLAWLLPEVRGWIIAGVVVLVAGIWLSVSYTRIGRLEPTEMGVMVVFGRMTKAVGPGGFHFVPWLPGCGILRYSTQQYKVDVPSVTVYTKDESVDGEQYSSEPIRVDPVVFLFMPRPSENGGKRLLQVAGAKIPTTEEGLVKHLSKAVQGIVQQAAGEVSWIKLITGLKDVQKRADGLFKVPGSVLMEAGFTPEDFDLAIVMHLPPELEKTIGQPDLERLKAQAAIFTGEGHFADEIRPVLVGFAKSAGMSLEAVKDKIRKSPKMLNSFFSYIQEVNLKLHQARLGARYDLGVEGATGMDRTMLQIATLLKKLSSGDGSAGNSGGSISSADTKRKTRKVDVMMGGALHTVEMDETNRAIDVKAKS